MLSVRFLAGEQLHVGRTVVSIIVMWPANRFLHNKKKTGLPPNECTH